MRDSARRDRFNRIAEQLSELLAKTDDRAAHRATAVALLHHKMPGVSWTGFYLLKNGDLVVDAYQGPVACVVLERHTGVCWAALDELDTKLVADVRSFPGHIACDPKAQSEIVVPIRDARGAAIGVLDVDSHLAGHFDEIDQAGYEQIIRLLEDRWIR